MRALSFCTFTLLLSINILQSKKYLIEVAEDEMADGHKVKNPACKCGVEREERKRIVGGTAVNYVIRLKYMYNTRL